MHTKIKLIIEFVEMQREKICRLCLVTAATAADSVAMDLFYVPKRIFERKCRKNNCGRERFFFLRCNEVNAFNGKMGLYELEARRFE